MSHETLYRETAAFAIGLTTSDCLPEVAVRLLVEGRDSPALRRLAGLGESEIDEAASLFRQSLLEMGCMLPTPREAVLYLAREIALQIVKGEVPPYEGGKRIWDLSSKIGHALLELHPFVYAASEWECRPRDRAFLEQGILKEARTLVGDE